LRVIIVFVQLGAVKIYVAVVETLRKKDQNPESGYTQGEIQKKPPKKYISIQGGKKLRKPSSLVAN
jgi:hypothetical protein